MTLKTLTIPANVIPRIMDAENLCAGQIFVSLSVRSDLRELFEAARKDTGSEEGTLFQGTYTYDADQVAEVVMRTVPVEDFGNEVYEVFSKVEVRITDLQ